MKKLKQKSESRFGKTKKLGLSLGLLLSQVFPAAQTANAGQACAHILICCKDNINDKFECNKGVKVLVNGSFNIFHKYHDLNQCRDLLGKLYAAGIRTVFIDITNSSQWNNANGGDLYPSQTSPALSYINQVCDELGDMNYCVMIWTGTWTKAETDERAGRIHGGWATKARYKKWGYGNATEAAKPMIIAFDNGSSDGNQFINAMGGVPNAGTPNLNKFKVVDCGSNTASGGFGYRCTQGSNQTDQNAVWTRFGSPNGGCSNPADWFRQSEADWKTRVDWVKLSTRYSVYGSYDDSCDSHMWSIADTSASTILAPNKYPGNATRLYYNVVQESLVGNTGVRRLIKRNNTAFSIDGGNYSATSPISDVGTGKASILWASSTTNLNQQWREVKRSNGFVSYLKRGTNFALSGGGGGASGQEVQVAVEDGNNQDQQWKKVSLGGTLFRLEKRNAATVSISGEPGGANGQIIRLRPNSNTIQDQHWDVKL